MARDDETWTALIEGLERSAKMYTANGSFLEICAVLAGYDVGAKTDHLRQFGSWISEARGGGSQSFVSFVVREAVPGREHLQLPLDDFEDEAATRTLFALLRDYLRDDSLETSA
jgi:hypothetical protein